MRKTYQLTRLFTLVMPLATSQGQTIAEFKGVQNMGMRGTYSTSNAAVQQALEASGEFRRQVFRLVGSEPETEEAAQEPADNAGAPLADSGRTRKAKNTDLFG